MLTESEWPATVPRAADEPGPGFVYLLPVGGQIYAGSWPQGMALRLNAACIVIAPNDEAIEWRASGVVHQSFATAVGPRAGGSLRVTRGRPLVFVIEPTHRVYTQLLRVATQQALQLPRTQFASVDTALNAAATGQLSTERATALFEDVTRIASRYLPRARPLDRRAEQIIQILAEDNDLALSDLASLLGVSYHRLSHIFSDSIGMSLRSYRQRHKVHQAMRLFHAGGYTLTRLAHDVGFVDITHLSRAFVGAFALPAGALLRGGRMQIIASTTPKVAIAPCGTVYPPRLSTCDPLGRVALQRHA
jgi:AraC-like DNA-binding protein